MAKVEVIKMLEAAMDEKLYTVSEVAKIFEVRRQTIHLWIAADRFPKLIEAGSGRGKVYLIPASDVAIVKEEEADKLRTKLERLGFQREAA